MKIELKSPAPKDVPGAVKLIITLEEVPAGEMFTVQYLNEAGKVIRQDKECNVKEGVLSEAVATL